MDAKEIVELCDESEGCTHAPGVQCHHKYARSKLAGYFDVARARQYAALLEVLENPATCTCTFYDLGELEPPPNCPRCLALIEDGDFEQPKEQPVS